MKSALVIVDMQEGIFKLKQPVYNEASLIENIKKVISWAKREGILVVFTQHENSTFLVQGTSSWQVVRQFEMNDDDIIIRKTHPSVLKEAEVLAIMRDNNICRLYIMGLISNGCIRESCMDAMSNDFEVVLVSDAHSTFYKNPGKVISQANKDMANAGAKLVTTDELISITDDM